ncbi:MULTISPECIES: manganese efflux pump MntP family protein [unclassified Campylobacter]|uniref:manganese efflux pump MntP n=1 Tax=unclassified Campylobacter TaxID=2593542 RepID=UPI003D345123
MLLLIALALAMDSVALSLANGANCQNLAFKSVAKMAFIFAFFQAIMPFLGYILGLSFVNFIKQVDHFIAFIILVFLGLKMIKDSRANQDESCLFDSLKISVLIAGAFATSIDALVVGVTFAFDDIAILNACFIIGIVCFILCILGFYLGKFAGKFLQDKALVLGGVILILLGVKILAQHLSDHGF